MDKFSQWVRDRHNYARGWKAMTGGKVLGYFCCYLPEEIAYAAGVLPVRVIPGDEPQDLSNLYIMSFFCPYCRNCLGEGLKGSYDYADGVALGHTCVQIDQTFESWRAALSPSFDYYLPVPGSPDESGELKPFFAAELGDFQRAIEQWTWRAVSNDDLQRAIDVYNRHRKLLHRLYDLRRNDPPPLSGARTFEIVLSSMLVDKAEHNMWLGELLDSLSTSAKRQRPGPRVMIIGGENHSPELLRLIEEQGANIVIDDLCMGSRYFWNEVATPSPLMGEGGGVSRETLLSSIAARYLDKPGCPVKDVSNFSGRPRHKHLMELVREWKVQGIFIVYQKFCHPQELDLPSLNKLFQENGLPTCVLELDTTLTIGQIKTRAQAFLEMLS
ncbi:MAG: 2-hydroxyacyl-CoA dehydratase [Chloroflexi bacterium]|nr:2-hydroxyacyl-CoA dehydratase [Chloroflexota bacterium]